MIHSQKSQILKLIEQIDWKNIDQHFEEIFLGKSIEEMFEVIEIIKKSVENNSDLKNKTNLLKWIFKRLTAEYSVYGNKNQDSDEKLLSYYKYFPTDSLKQFLDLQVERGELEWALLLTKEILSRENINSSILLSKSFLEILKWQNDPSMYLSALHHCIFAGRQDIAKTMYGHFYKSYFSNYSLEDSESRYWDELWSKLSQIKETWATWEILKLEVGLLTDIIIKIKTGLSLPFFRKKREITKAITFCQEFQTFKSTLLKYIYAADNKELVETWLSYCRTKEQGKCSLTMDQEEKYIINEVLLSRPKAKPKLDQLSMADMDNATVIIGSENLGTSDVDSYAARRKIELALRDIDENIDPSLPAERPVEKNWKDLVNTYAHQKYYQNVISTIDEHLGEVHGEEKSNYEIFRLEMLIQLGEFKKTLDELESMWAKVQELEIFKALKYIEGEALWGLNRKKEAIDCFRKVIDIDPTYKLAKWRVVEYSL